VMIDWMTSFEFMFLNPVLLMIFLWES
jgi:hypothetical protein